MIELLVNEYVWDLNKSFNISRGAKLTANTVQIELIKDGEKGLGECVPYSRYNETINSVKRQINELKSDIENGDLTAIEELLKLTPMSIVKGYLSEG